jgi:hypothetical protein
MKILDCFSANGVIWENICDKTEISVLRIEKRKSAKGIYLIGDNLKYLASLDLAQFDCIDLDAFGVPYKQLEIIFPKIKSGCVIFCTFIQSVFGVLPTAMLCKLGYTLSMIRSIPTLFYASGFEKFCNYLSLNGVKSVKYYQKHNKYYLVFVKN